jgi:uncharacterized membrane protein YfcA
MQGLGLGALGVLVTLAQGCGMGGGPVFATLLQVLYHLETKSAVKYSYVLLLGGSLATTAANLSKTDSQGFPLVNYELVMITLPSIIVGSIVGVYVENLLPDFVLTCILIVFFVAASVQAYFKIKEKDG